MRVQLRFQSLRADGSLRSKWDRLLKIVADFEIIVEERPLFFQTEFPVVEFWLQLTRWLDGLVTGGTNDFEYQTMESDEPALVWFCRRSVGWLVGCLDPEYEEAREFELSEVVHASREFVTDLEREVCERFGINLAKLAADFRPVASESSLRGPPSRK